ncbi:FliA/WhiG family RNA polymerase sigma factor [Alphaproteobacteria bacterium]|nr:FliA/WhiG family RNA polymerase sigma factor [Alphaproteobacteria bacterium]
MKNQYLEQKPDIEGLITGHMELVRQIAWHMHGRVRASIEIEDLVQIGYYGLVMAAQNYTVQEGATFASYASLRIRGSIVDHLRKNSNLCRTTIQMQQQANKAEADLQRKLGRAPTKDEMAEKIGITEDEMMGWEQAFQANVHQSLDSVYDDFSIWFVSLENTPEDNINDNQLREILKSALKTLPEREALVIQLYYVEELNVYEIAEVLEVTTGRVSQIKKAAIGRLRTQIQQLDGSAYTS